MVEVKFDLVKRDFFWIGLIVVLFAVGFSYAYGGFEPDAMGHSGGEIELTGDTVVSNDFCKKVTGEDCPEPEPVFVDSDGDGVADADDCAPNNPDDSILIKGDARVNEKCDCREKGLGQRDCWSSFFEKGDRFCVDNKGADAGGTCRSSGWGFDPSSNAAACRHEDADDANGDDDYFYKWQLCV
jgi:hypothetical protein